MRSALKTNNTSPGFDSIPMRGIDEQYDDSVVCDKVCRNFSRMLNHWPHTKAAVYYLASAQRVNLLIRSLKSVMYYVAESYMYPVVIFHELDFTPAVQDFVRKRIRHLDLYFQEISFRFPDHINSSRVVFNISCTSPISYRHMCQFQAKTAFEHPILSDVKYLLRLDDDSELLDKIGFDIFQFMEDRGLLYGYLKKHWDSLDCTRDLWPATASFINQRKIVPTFFADWPEGQIYYNNFEVFALSIFKSPEYVDFISYLDRLGGIFYHRWGDAPIKSLALSMLVPRNKTHHFTQIAYKHGNFVTNATYSSF